MLLLHRQAAKERVPRKLLEVIQETREKLGESITRMRIISITSDMYTQTSSVNGTEPEQIYLSV